MAKPEKVKEEQRAVTPWRPLSEITRMEREFDRMFEDFFSTGWNPFRRAFSRLPRLAVSTPAVDVYAQKDEIIAKVELPGIDKDEISVNVSDHILTIKGEKKREDEVKEEDYHYSERSYGAFVRSTELPTGTNR